MTSLFPVHCVVKKTATLFLPYLWFLLTGSEGQVFQPSDSNLIVVVVLNDLVFLNMAEMFTTKIARHVESLVIICNNFIIVIFNYYRFARIQTSNLRPRFRASFTPKAAGYRVSASATRTDADTSLINDKVQPAAASVFKTTSDFSIIERPPRSGRSGPAFLSLAVLHMPRPLAPQSGRASSNNGGLSSFHKLIFQFSNK